MARVFSLMTCVMLFLTVNESTLKSTEGAQLGNGSSSGGNLTAVVNDLVAAVKSLKEDLQKTRVELEAVKRQTSNIGSTFVRWGRKVCPVGTTQAYLGVAGGKHHDEKGDGTNSLCLTLSPKYDASPIPRHYGYLYGAEYENMKYHNYNVPCSVCRAPQSTTIMMATTYTCPLGWTVQYTGYLTSQRHNLYATEYVCLDRDPEVDSNGEESDQNQDGLLFYFVLSVCGSLPCPLFQNRKIVTCVVCSR